MYRDRLGCFVFWGGESIRDFDLGDVVVDAFLGVLPLMLVCANSRCCEFMFLRVIVCLSRRPSSRICVQIGKRVAAPGTSYCCGTNSSVFRNIMFFEL
jgi:hypothetical protein